MSSPWNKIFLHIGWLDAWKGHSHQGGNVNHSKNELIYLIGIRMATRCSSGVFGPCCATAFALAFALALALGAVPPPPLLGVLDPVAFAISTKDFRVGLCPQGTAGPPRTSGEPNHSSQIFTTGLYVGTSFGLDPGAFFFAEISTCSTPKTHRLGVLWTVLGQEPGFLLWLCCRSSALIGIPKWQIVENMFSYTYVHMEGICLGLKEKKPWNINHASWVTARTP